MVNAIHPTTKVVGVLAGVLILSILEVKNAVITNPLVLVTSL